MIMTHPGLPAMWGYLVIACMLAGSLWFLLFPLPDRPYRHAVLALVKLPVLGSVLKWMSRTPWVVLCFKLLMVGFFLTVIYSGLVGTPVPERNFATLITWNLWWAGLIFSVFFLGSAWCAICPWDAIASWLVRRRLWKRAHPNNSLNLRVPRYLNNVFPALLMFIGLTWLELGLGITTSPYATAIVSLLMIVLATVSLAVFKRKAFCQHFCPVGRTIGFYSQLSAIELRPIDASICAGCKTLECYHGTDSIEPCPTSLVMGTLKQNSYCTSCGNCAQSCPHENVAWRLRTPNTEATQEARPRWDEAWFMLGLLALTGFHGLTMMPFWEDWMHQLARLVHDGQQMLGSFTVGILLALAVVAVFYLLMVVATRYLTKTPLSMKQSFATFSFVALPLAFFYHLAHNLNHLVRESSGIWSVIINPTGAGTQPLSMMEKHQRHMSMWMSEDMLFALQAGLMIAGFVMAIQILRYRGRSVLATDTNRAGWRLAPILFFILGMTGFHLWMLMQPMVMRM